MLIRTLQKVPALERTLAEAYSVPEELSTLQTGACSLKTLEELRRPYRALLFLGSVGVVLSYALAAGKSID